MMPEVSTLPPLVSKSRARLAHVLELTKEIFTLEQHINTLRLELEEELAR
jgi:hypothetical protein